MRIQDKPELAAAIKSAALAVPLDLMMTVAAQEARLLADRYRDTGLSEREILVSLVMEVEKRKAL